MTDRKERRRVAVLFCDLKGFSRMSERMDPEEVGELIDSLFQRLRAAIEAHGGSVDKFIGDAVMAVFGAPSAHEDDARRAVRSALRMQQEMEAFNRERGLALAIRIGINVGEVLWGAIAGERSTAMGDAVNVAQRLESACAPGKILISDSVESETRPWIGTRKLDPVAVKGRDQEVPVFEVTGEVEYQPAFREVAGIQTRMVGRQAELGLLTQRLRRCVKEREPAFVWIEGEAGVGKSRLVYELRRAVSVCEWRGRCSEEDRGAFASLAQALKPRLATLPSDLEALGRYDAVERKNFADLVSIALGQDVPGAAVKGLPPERVETERRLAFRVALEALSRTEPLLLVLEDLHWADAETPKLLADLAATLKRGALMIVATARPGTTAPAGFEGIRLMALGDEGMKLLAGEIFSGPPGPALSAYLLNQSGGNPYFAVELARYLLEHGLIERDPPELASETIRVPSTLNGLLVSRLDALTDEKKDIIKGASVVGELFWRRLLETALGRSVAGELEALEAAEHVVQQDDSALPGDDEYAFRHALLRAAAYSLVTKKERVKLHGILGGLFEKAGIRELAAHHFERAGDGPAASRNWLAASQEAQDVSAFEQALACATRAGPGPEAARLQANSLNSLARFSEAEQAARRGLDSAADPFLKADLMLSVANTLARSSRYAESVALSEEIERTMAAREGPEAALRAAQAINIFCGSLIRQSDYSTALGRLEKALARVDGATREIRRTRASILQNIALARTQMGDYDQALDPSRQALELWRALGDRYGVALATNVIGISHLGRGEYALAMQAYRQSLETYREVGARSGVAKSLSNIGIIHWQNGEIDAATGRFRDSLRLFREIGDRNSEGFSLALHGLGHAHVGEYDRAMELLRESRSILRQVGDRRMLGRTLAEIALVQAERGNADEAIEAVRESIELARTIGAKDNLASALLSCCEVNLELGSSADLAPADEARRLGDQLQEPRYQVWSRAVVSRITGDPSSLEEARPIAESPRCPYHERLRFWQACAVHSKPAAQKLIEMARASNARAYLARGLALAGEREAARQIALELGLKPLLARLGY